MVFDTSNIDTIEKAKNAKYNKKDLESSDKAIFDDDKLKPGGTLDVTKLKDTAKLLDAVKRAEAKTSKDTTLIVELKGAKTKNDVAYQILSTKVDAQITRLEGFSDSPTYKTKTEED